MKVNLLDAIDIFGNGGYIDLHNMRYIPQKWYWEMFPDSAPDMTVEKYRQIPNSKECYLTTPRLKSTGIVCITALNMGLSNEALLHLGAKDNKYWDLFVSSEDIDDGTNTYRSSDEEWAFVKNVEKYMRSIGKYNDYCSEKSNVIQKTVKNWFFERGIEIE